MCKQKNLLAIIFLLFGTVQLCFSQTYAYYKTRKYIKNYTWLPDFKLKASGLQFPVFDDMESLGQSFLLPNQSILNFKTKSDTPEKISSLNLVLRFFVQNVSIAEFKITDNQSHELKRTVKFISQGYQPPLFLNFDSLSAFDKKNLKIAITFQNLNTKNLARFIVGDAWLGDSKIEKHLSPSKTFMDLPYSNPRSTSSVQLTPFESTGQYLHFPTDQYEEHYKSNVFIEDSLRKPEEILNDVFFSLLRSYPFYNERNLDKNQILTKAEALLREKSSLCDKVAKISHFLNTELKDPHFSIQSKCSLQSDKPLITPIYCYNFNDRAIVSAILDTELEEKIPLGSEILEINGKRISLSKEFTVDHLHQLLKKTPGEKMIVKLINPAGITDEVNYSLKPMYSTSKKYSGNKGDTYTFLNDSTTYYKINSINDQTINTFISNLDSINTKKNLILDFRNCGGGDFLAGARFLSSFIQKPFKYFDFEKLNSNKLDSVIVNRNLSPSNFRENGRIAVIINKNSACVAELLAGCLKKERANAKIFGSESSIGALAFTYQVVLPNEEISFTTNAISYGKILINGKSIETKGIVPDVLVKLEKVEDLAPYEDKVLRAAVNGI
ncbi:hypothetical protein AY601_3520 [Pedobacter cryoconitis]|uniref:Tail specific protease domain-containing protein n=1 Tax=Pedobacter cryoconitis TaxID=188932 RepID=A0A127VGF1_9SPHI|nr:S41 family peptidase [Pedobacter cryoconitis]AMQ00386.1 hypothetical protein AY601_3520 [Pedobacter cryoconitis]